MISYYICRSQCHNFTSINFLLGNSIGKTTSKGADTALSKKRVKINTSVFLGENNHIPALNEEKCAEKHKLFMKSLFGQTLDIAYPSRGLNPLQKRFIPTK